MHDVEAVAFVQVGEAKEREADAVAFGAGAQVADHRVFGSRNVRRRRFARAGRRRTDGGARRTFHARRQHHHPVSASRQLARQVMELQLGAADVGKEVVGVEEDREAGGVRSYPSFPSRSLASTE
jgi:hypothetical protein